MAKAAETGMKATGEIDSASGGAQLNVQQVIILPMLRQPDDVKEPVMIERQRISSATPHIFACTSRDSQGVVRWS
jgi:hypothetical protein